jgi:hypothetical protein
MSCPDRRTCAEIRFLAGNLQLIADANYGQPSRAAARILEAYEATFGPLPQWEDPQ